ncbi:xanthine dehydrogenase family protein molybdopterin-binding subunit [Streptomyces decoyicus]|uniref:xanthine dehydrogenase family protein molybdopterin-binding subunit n=1 Tax=Streptomyces decoyicus TaxID=249567 RepID=UPI00364446BB
MRRPAFAIESAMDELARALHMDPLELRRRNIVRPGEPLLAMQEGPDDVTFTEDGLAKCIDLVDEAMARTADQPPPGPGWLVGAGVASSLHETAPPTEHLSEAWVTLGDDLVYELAVGTVEFGEGTSTAHVQIAAHQLGTTPSRIRLVQSDTDRTGSDTGAFASAGLFVAGNAVLRAANAVRDRILEFAAAHTGEHLVMCSMEDESVRCGDRRVPLAELVAAARARGIRFTAARKAYGSPRSVTSNTQGFRIPAYAGIPRTEVLLVDSADSVGPLRSKGIAECCINPVAPAPANALHDATGVRFRALPLTPERIYRRLGDSAPVTTGRRT